MVVSALMLLAVPFAAWGAWRLLTVVGHLVDTRDMPRWLHVWGAVTYGLVPATSGAWGEGRFGTVAVAALLPWTAHAALGFADPDRDRRWRAAWRTALLVALGAAFVPGVWLFAVLAAAVVLGVAAFISPRLLRDRHSWGPPVVALAMVPVLLAPWIVPLVTTGSAEGLLLEAGRLPGDRVDFVGLLTGRLGDLGAPWWLGALLGLLAILALLPRSTRVPVLACWLVALAAAVVVAGLGFVTLELPAIRTRPSLGLFVVILQGLAVIATVAGRGGLPAAPPRRPAARPVAARPRRPARRRRRRSSRSGASSGGWPTPTGTRSRARSPPSSRPTWSRARCSATSTACWSCAARSTRASTTASCAVTASRSARTRCSPSPTRTST